MKRDRCAASHMGYYDRDIPVGLPYSAGISPYHRPRIEGMEKRASRKLGKPSYLHFRQHLVRHRRIGYKCPAPLCDASAAARLIDFHCNVVSYKRAQIARMHSVPSRDEGLPHVLVDFIDARADRSHKTSACHDNINAFKLNAPLDQKLRNGITTHQVLVHYRAEFRKFPCRMCKILLKQLASGIVETYFCRGGAGVDYQYSTFHAKTI